MLIVEAFKRWWEMLTKRAETKEEVHQQAGVQLHQEARVMDTIAVQLSTASNSPKGEPQGKPAAKKATSKRRKTAKKP